MAPVASAKVPSPSRSQAKLMVSALSGSLLRDASRVSLRTEVDAVRAAGVGHRRVVGGRSDREREADGQRVGAGGGGCGDGGAPGPVGGVEGGARVNGPGAGSVAGVHDDRDRCAVRGAARCW